MMKKDIKAMPFDVLKKRLMYRLDVMGVRILKVHEEVRGHKYC